MSPATPTLDLRAVALYGPCRCPNHGEDIHRMDCPHVQFQTSGCVLVLR